MCDFFLSLSSPTTVTTKEKKNKPTSTPKPEKTALSNARSSACENLTFYWDRITFEILIFHGNLIQILSFTDFSKRKAKVKCCLQDACLGNCYE